MKTKKMIGIALLASLAFVISYFSFPILPLVTFLKIDFSDLPILAGTLFYGPVSGILIAFIRSFLHYLMTGGELGFPIGDGAAFIASVALLIPIYYALINKPNKKRRNHVIASVLGTLSLTTALTLLNWVILVPAYSYVLNFDVGPMRTYLLLGVIPFNLIKGLIVCSVFFSVFPKIQPFLFKKKLTK